MPAVRDVLSRLLYTKLLTSDQLHHTEWSRKLGPAHLVCIACMVSVPASAFILLPHSLHRSASAPVCLLSLLIAFLIFILVGCHLIELCLSVPKSCCVYQLTFAVAGHAAAFQLGWLSIVEYCLLLAVVGGAWSQHVRSLFGMAADAWVWRVVWPQQQQQPAVLAGRLDLLCFVALLVGLLLLLASIRVASTVCLTLLIVCCLVLTSSILVGLFYANPVNWMLSVQLDAPHLLNAVRAAALMLYGYVGVEACTYLLDECQMPVKRVPVLVPVLNLIVTVFAALLCMVATLAVQPGDLKTLQSLPEMYETFGRPAAKYVLNVGAVCGLSGTLLCVYLPASRLQAAMAHDRLLSACCTRLGKHTGAPYTAIASTCALACLLSVLLQPAVAIELLAASFVLRLLCATLLAVQQRYTEQPVGLEQPVASYRKLRGARACEADDDEADSLTPACSQCALDQASLASSTNSNNSAASSMLFRHIALLQTNVANYEAIMANQLIPRSVSGSNYKADDGDVDSSDESDDDDARAMRAAVTACAHTPGHNCLKSPCSPSDDFAETQMHLYDRPVLPDLTLRTVYSDGDLPAPSSPSSDQSATCARVLRLLVAFVCLALANAAVVLRALPWLLAADGTIVPHLIWLQLCLQTLFSLALMSLALAIARQPSNAAITKRRRVVRAFPATSLLVIWLLCQLLVASRAVTLGCLLAVVALGTVVYALTLLLCSPKHQVASGTLYMNQALNNEQRPFVLCEADADFIGEADGDPSTPQTLTADAAPAADDDTQTQLS